MARTGSRHLKACQHRLKGLVMGSGKNRFLPELSGKNWFLPFKSVSTQAERVSYGKWQEPVLAINKWQEPVLAIFKACRHRLKGLVMGSGKSHGTCHFIDLKNGKSHWTCHCESVSRQAELVSYGEWQEPVLAIIKWQEPVLAIFKASRDRLN